MAYVDEFDLAVATQCVDDGIESVSNNSVTAFDTGVCEHLPQNICNFSRHKNLRSEMKFRHLQSDSICYANRTASRSNHLLIQSIAGTVIARARVEIKSIEAISDWAALYRAANSTTTEANGKLHHTNDSRAKGLTTCKKCSRANRTADWAVIRASEPARTPG